MVVWVCLPQPGFLGIHNFLTYGFLIVCAVISHRLSQTLFDWKTKMYWSICHPPHHSIPTISSKQWSTFWAWPMEHTARNIWYRTLHNMLPTTSRHYQFQLSTAPTPICALCNSNIDTTDHFIIGCPYKYEIWQLVWG
ncbi:hypothetical protein BDC45DRAFT_562713 [Circinella umbellata]|nr:hypothetical protein BDC45DRAFT_562713 [Circinella umbellata]